VTQSQPKEDQWNAKFDVQIQEVSDFDVKVDMLVPHCAIPMQTWFRLDVESLGEFLAVCGAQSEDAAVLNLSRPIGEQWNSMLFHDALRACREHHGETCEAPASAFQSAPEVSSSSPARVYEQLKVVDVINMCITTLPSGSSYMALSYCWAKRRYSVLTLANYDKLHMTGGLHSLELPPTISDTFAAMEAIDEKYIWIDSLCIVQDDHQNKAAELARMDDIYRAASLTIVAANAPHDGTDVGLFGVRPSSTRDQADRVLDIRGMRFRNCFPRLLYSLGDTRWHSRAWTFQEYLLSKRHLIFMPEQVYFICRQANFSEDHIDHICASQTAIEQQKLMPCCASTALDNMSDGKDDHRPSHYISSYKDLVSAYTKRQLSFDQDAVNATRGLLNLLKLEYGIEFLCGLPVPHLVGYFLTWAPIGSSIRRGSSFAEGGRFPSWSWAGWQGEAAYPSTAFPGADPRDGLDSDGMHVEFEDEIAEWEVVLTDDIGAGNPSVAPGKPAGSTPDLASIDRCYLRFTAEVSVFSITKERHCAFLEGYKPGEVQRPTCHTIHIKGADIRVGVAIMHRVHADAAPYFDVQRPQVPTFMAVSRGRARWHMWYPVEEGRPTDYINAWYQNDNGTHVDRPPFDEDNYELEGCVVNVLLICTSGDGMMYRAGVGQIHADAWDASSPERRQIVLG
jgi:hypothetical protein